MSARCLMVQGTGSSVGKSLLVAALCRALHDRGLRVLPFKAQNMALNAFVCADGAEIGRAQAMQAQAARVSPTADMNPILLKPEDDVRSQLVVLGRAVDRLAWREYQARRRELWPVVCASLARLRAAADVVVIEGAGSPAEVNLRTDDLVNMAVAHEADAPVLLVGDVERGGVFASLVGTLALLDDADRARIAGFVINKFRGDRAILEPGIAALEGRTGVRVAGVLPYLPDLAIADEDSLDLAERRRRQASPGDGGPRELRVAVVHLPRVANHEDLSPLEREPGVALRWVADAAETARADLAVVPGSKSTVADLSWMRERGIAAAIADRASRAAPTLAICGGMQMLGRSIRDPDRVESSLGEAPGLGILAIDTVFGRDKVTARLEGRLARPCLLGGAADLGTAVRGYEMHCGRIVPVGDPARPLEVVRRGAAVVREGEGAIAAGGAVVGTLVHGLLDADGLRAAMLAGLRRACGLPQASVRRTDPEAEIDRLTAAVAAAVDLDWIAGLVGA